jgi:uncharacterized PurR-regulated membrane protein YhhQ (DUF165 family)
MKNNMLVQSLWQVSHFHVLNTRSKLLAWNRLRSLSSTITGDWLAPLIFFLIASGMCLAIVVVLLLTTE